MSETDIRPEYELPSIRELRKQCLKELWEGILVPINVMCVLGGYLFGFAVISSGPPTISTKAIIGFPGEILSRMLDLVTLPLMIAGTFTGVTMTRFRFKKLIAIRVGTFWSITTFLGVLSGLLLVLLIRPGMTKGQLAPSITDIFNGAAVMNVIINLTPENLISACVEQPKIIYSFEEEIDNSTSTHPPIKEGFNTLSLILVSTVYAMILRRAQRAQSFVRAVADFYEVVKFWLAVVLRYMPLGLLSFGMHRMADAKDPLALSRFGAFIGLTILALLIDGLIIQPLVFFAMTTKNPFVVIKGSYPAMIATLVTSSRDCCHPILLYCLEKRNKFDRFIIDAMMTTMPDVCKDGTILYNIMAVSFVAQVADVEMSLLLIFQIIVAVVAFSIRTPRIVELESITTFLIISALQMPVRESVALVLLEWFFARLCKTVNLLKQSFCIGLAHNVHKQIVPIVQQETEVTT